MAGHPPSHGGPGALWLGPHHSGLDGADSLPLLSLLPTGWCRFAMVDTDYCSYGEDQDYLGKKKPPYRWQVCLLSLVYQC